MKQKNEVVVAVLALQGAFAEHERMLEKLGVKWIELRQEQDLNRDFDALILPGGESTVQGKLLKDLHMFEPLQKRIKEGLPVLATCAGLILLAEKLTEQNTKHFATLPVVVQRNAYGRQLGSFSMEGTITDMGNTPYPMEFIRAPYITEVSNEVKILARDQEQHIVAVGYKNQMAFAFHPELTEDTRIHKYFLEMVRNAA